VNRPVRRVFRILVVCTGNQCRSPALERMLGRLLVTAPDSPFDLDSAGTDAPPGHPVHPDTADALTRRGVPALGHTSQLLRPDQVTRADLILVAERRHRAAVLHADGHARPRTFTITEFERLVADAVSDEPAGPWELVAAADTRRHHSGGSPNSDDDIADPVKGNAFGHEATVTRLQKAASTIAAGLVASLTVHNMVVSVGRHQETPRYQGCPDVRTGRWL
jgi:protein-tyrosine phosphatase